MTGNVVPFRRRPLTTGPLQSDGTFKTTCDELVHVFEHVPGRCQCGDRVWDALPSPATEAGDPRERRDP